MSAVPPNSPNDQFFEMLADAQAEEAAKAPSKTGRRWAIFGMTFVVVLGLVGGGAVLANSLVRGVAEDAIAQQLQSASGGAFAGGVEVKVGGEWPLVNFLQGFASEVTISVPGAIVREVPVDLDLRVKNVKRDLTAPVDSVDVTIALDQDAVNAFLPAPDPGATLTLGDNEVTYAISRTGPFGVKIGADVTATAAVAGTTLSLKPIAAQVTTPLGSISAQPIIDAILGSQPVELCLADRVPQGTEITGLEISPNRLVITAHGKNIVLSAALLRSTGTCP